MCVWALKCRWPCLSFDMIAFFPDRERVYVKGKDVACRTLLYCKNGAGENDYVTLIREDNGEWFTARIDQIVSAPNPTLDIEESSDA